MECILVIEVGSAAGRELFAQQSAGFPLEVSKPDLGASRDHDASVSDEGSDKHGW